MEKRDAIRTLIQLGQLPTPEKVAELLEFKPVQSQQEVQAVPSSHRKLANGNACVEIVQSYEYTPKKIEISDFVNYFRNRYSFLKNILVNKQEVENAVSISHLSQSYDKVSIIGIVSDIKKLPTGTFKIVLEDFSGKINAVISAKNPELLEKASQLTFDDIAAFKGSCGKDIFFVNDIIWPDIPIKQRTLSQDEVYAVFTGDLHAGSNKFLPDELSKFVKWLNREIGDEKQKEIAEKTKYVFILGDLVDGIGIYPEQEKELEVKDIYKQYALAGEFISKIPKDKIVVVCPGNHDAMRICEPQPAIYKDLAEPLYKMENVVHVSNPAIVNIHKQDNFSGLNVLMYHGYSFDHFVDVVEHLRNQGGYDAPDKIIEFLLKRRHLAPSYGSTLALPMLDDPLLIKQVPDIVATGHIHKAKIGNYKNVLTIAASCWQDRTSFQERVGHHPEPAFVPLLNLHTGKALMMKF